MLLRRLLSRYCIRIRLNFRAEYLATDNPQRRQAAVYLKRSTAFKHTRASKTAPMSAVAYLQVLGGSGSIGPSAFLFTEDKRYMFNCGEGTQRFCGEHKIRLKNVADIFFTQSSWECIGGLPGMLLTIQDAFPGSPSIALHAPRYLRTVWRGTMTFMQHRSSLYRALNEYSSPSTTFNDGRLSMTAFVIKADNVQRDVPEFLKEDPNYAYMQKEPAPQQDIGAKFDHQPLHSQDMIKKAKRQESSQSRSPSPSSKTFASSDCGEARKEMERIEPPTHSELQNAASEVACTTVVYVGSFISSRSGKFNVSKAIALGIPKGPMWGKLGKGESIFLDDGRQIQPEEVLDPIEPMPHFAVIHVGSREQLHAVLKRADVFASFRSHSGNNGSVLHFTSKALVETDAYTQLLEKFGPNVRHIFSDPNLAPHSTNVASTRLQYMLQTINPDVFSLASLPKTTPTIDAQVPDTCSKVVARPLYKVFLSKRRDGLLEDQQSCLDWIDPVECKSSIKESLISNQKESPGQSIDNVTVQRNALQQMPQLHSSSFTDLSDAIACFQDSNRTVREAKYNGDPCLNGQNCVEGKHHNIEQNDVFLHFMGTGSAIPSKHRNVTCMLLTRGIFVDRQGVTHFAENAACMLLDCGEGSYTQLTRKFGKKHMPHLLRTLELVHISHMHADHHLGLTRILQQRESAFTDAGIPVKPVVIIAPQYLWLFMRHTAHLSLDRSMYINAFLTRFNGDNVAKHVPQPVCDALKSACQQMGIRSFATPLVKHCFGAHGLVIDFENNMKFVWSGDTRPCKSLVKAGKGANVLVHEATFADELADQAVQKQHSTTADAVSVMQQMQAETLILTHFSQRYPEIPVLSDSNRKHTAFGFDLMGFPLSKATILASMTPAIDEMFKCLQDEYDDDCGGR